MNTVRSCQSDNMLKLHAENSQRLEYNMLWMFWVPYILAGTSVFR